jgi:Domain of unknown function (DUF4388)
MALEGSLHDMPLVDLIEIFQLGEKSGALLLNGYSESAVLYLTMGRLIDAAIIRKPTHQVITRGDQAVRLLLGWEDATFVLRHDPSVMKRPVTIFQTAEQLIQGSQRRGDQDGDSFVAQQGVAHVEIEAIWPRQNGDSRGDHDPSRYDTTRQTHTDAYVPATMDYIDTMRDLPTMLDLEPVDWNEIIHMPAPDQGLGQTLPNEPQPDLGVASTTPPPRKVPTRRLLQAVMRRVRGL